MPPIDADELGRLYREHAAALRLFVRQWGGDEDQVQEAFVKLARQASPLERPVAWLYRVARNAAWQASRGLKRLRRRHQRACGPQQWFVPTSDQLDGEQAAALLAQAPLELREVIVARIWGGLTFEEIAELVGCSLPTAHRRYQAGLSQLKEKMEGRWTKASQTRTT